MSFGAVRVPRGCAGRMPRWPGYLLAIVLFLARFGYVLGALAYYRRGPCAGIAGRADDVVTAGGTANRRPITRARPVPTLSAKGIF
jgi:hypothetical protein